MSSQGDPGLYRGRLRRVRPVRRRGLFFLAWTGCYKSMFCFARGVVCAVCPCSMMLSCMSDFLMIHFRVFILSESLCVWAARSPSCAEGSLLTPALLHLAPFSFYILPFLHVWFLLQSSFVGADSCVVRRTPCAMRWRACGLRVPARARWGGCRGAPPPPADEVADGRPSAPRRQTCAASLSDAWPTPHF